nr:MAG TPA: hypothetical protein [Caudoviricetes sp.]
MIRENYRLSLQRIPIGMGVKYTEKTRDKQFLTIKGLKI